MGIGYTVELLWNIPSLLRRRHPTGQEGPPRLPGLGNRVPRPRSAAAKCLGEATDDDVPRRFKGVQADQAEKLLESLAAVGVAIETTASSGSKRTWGLLR